MESRSSSRPASNAGLEAPEQLDLFYDSVPVRTARELFDSLRARDAERAGRALARIENTGSDYRNAAAAAVLIEALRAPDPDGPAAGFERLDRLERQWCPAAQAVLGEDAADFLAPLWQAAAQAIEAARFDPAAPERHASAVYARADDWESVKRVICAAPEYPNEPALVARLAEAEYRLQNRVGAIEHWFALCRDAPKEFQQHVEAPGFPDPAVKRAWSDARDDDREPAISPEWFPVWMLFEEPGLATRLEPLPGDDGPARAFRIAMELLTGNPPDEREIALRRALRATHGVLLARYLERCVSPRERPIGKP